MAAPIFLIISMWLWAIAAYMVKFHDYTWWGSSGCGSTADFPVAVPVIWVNLFMILIMIT